MTVSVQTIGGGAPARALSLPWIVAASSVGMLIEWYDFYLYGTLAVVFAKYFFPPGNDNLALLASLAVFWFGFILGPFGAIFFGHLGDLIGRKFTFNADPRHNGACNFAESAASRAMKPGGSPPRS
jgi:MFS family permease